MMQQIPVHPEAITREWLSQVLDAAVTDCRVAAAHAGTTGRAVLELGYRGSVDLPARLFVKLPPTEPQQQAFVVSNGMGRREVRFYQQLAGELPLRVPRCYFAACDERGEAYIMLLEHLEDSGCSFRNARTQYSPQYLRSVLAAFARLHAAFRESPRFAADLAWVEPPMQQPIARKLVQRALERHATQMPAVFGELGELYLEHTDAIHRLWCEGAATLVHGDVHDGNLFMDGAEPGFLDWAVLAKAPGMRDVGYFLAGTVQEGDRGSFRELLQFYRGELERQGVPAPDADTLWRQFQWHSAYVWLGAAVTLAMGDAWQPVNYLQASLKRLHGALEEIGTAQALRTALLSR